MNKESLMFSGSVYKLNLVIASHTEFQSWQYVIMSAQLCTVEEGRPDGGQRDQHWLRATFYKDTSCDQNPGLLGTYEHLLSSFFWIFCFT